jgi:methylenetetrahydrofolate dehydrogenase (NADP+)/methenyltetrahydrofolate cyclohydrolase
MQRIDGKAIANRIQQEVRESITTSGLHPRFGALLVGDDQASHIYVNRKERICAEVGIETDIRRLPAETTDDKLLSIIHSWNTDETIDAILVQVPLPPGHDTDAIIAAIDPRKDADGFHPTNNAALLAGEGTIFPPVHEGVLRLIAETGRDMRGAKTVILANSDIFSAPLRHLLERAGAFVTVFNPDDFVPSVVKDADIIVIAVGRPKFLTRDLIKSGAVVIDIGTNRTSDGRVVGDVDAEQVSDIDGWLSPVPGGVGPLTIALLTKNIFELAQRRRGIYSTRPSPSID